MRALVQRVSEARVEVEGRTTGSIGAGLLVLLGVGREDGAEQAQQLVDKILQLRIFPDEQGKMNRSLLDTDGELAVVSQFTLWGDCRKGRRPSFVAAAPPELAESLYEQFIELAARQNVRVASGRFGADMQVQLVNDGPVTIWLDTDDWRRPRREPRS